MSSPPAGSELWARNPHSYIRECVEAGALQIAWDRGTVWKYQIDPQRHALTHAPGRNFRILLIGDQGAAELDADHGFHNPKAVYPVWEYGQYALDVLEDLMAANRAAEIRGDMLASGVAYPPDETPVVGQEHRVVVTKPPPMSTGIGLRFFDDLAALQRDYPKCILHVHGYNTLRWVGAGIRSGDIDLRMMASKGSLLLPTGRQVRFEEADKHRIWLDLLGWHAADFSVPRNRCMFNIQAAMWSAENWHNSKGFGNTRALMDAQDIADLVNGRDIRVVPMARDAIARRRTKIRLVGDRFFCEACALQTTCRQFRVGSICALPDSESVELARSFRTRDARQVVDGLGKMMEKGLLRLADGLEAEDATGELDPHVTAMHKTLFNQGVTLAKLLDPKLRSAAVAVQVNGGNGQIVTSSSGDALPFQTRVANAYTALEAQGVPEGMITEEMLQRVIDVDNDPDAVREVILEQAGRTALPAGLTFDDDEVADAEIVEE